MNIGNCIKMPKVRLNDQIRAPVFTCQIPISSLVCIIYLLTGYPVRTTLLLTEWEVNA